MKKIIFQNTKPEEIKRFLEREDINVLFIEVNETDNSTTVTFMENN